MEGEDGSSDDPRSFTSKAPWKRCIILAAGAFMNFLTGFVILMLLYATATGFRTLEITGFVEGCRWRENCKWEMSLRKSMEITFTFSRIFKCLRSGLEKEAWTLTVRRNGERVVLQDVDMTKRDYVVDGQVQHVYGLVLGGVEEKTIGSLLKNAWNTSIDFARMVKMGLLDLISGRAGMKDMSGPVAGIVDTIQETGQSAGIDFRRNYERSHLLARLLRSIWRS